MSHEIENEHMGANASAVFSAREGAGWTGLGRAIPSDIAKDPAKIAAFLGADWKVIAQPAFYQNERGEFIRIPGTMAQVRSDNGQSLCTSSESRYHTDNRQPSDVFEAFRDELATENMEISHAAVLKGGQIIVVSALMSPDFDIDVGGKGRDIVKSYTNLSTGYDKKHGTKKSKSGMRVVCNNTLQASIAIAKQIGSLKTLRASQVLEADTLKSLVENTMLIVEAERIAYDAMANAKLSDADLSRYFADVLEVNIEDLGKVDRHGKKVISTKTENMLTALTAAYTQGRGAAVAHGNLWGALNAVTHYATHDKTVRDMSGDGEDAARVASNLFGDAAVLKERAQSLALSRAQVLVAA